MKLQEQLFRKIKAQGKSIKTAETYWHYCEDYLLRLKHKSGNWIHPSKAGRLEIEEWLSYLANEKHVSKNSQNTALQAVLYLYREILGVSIQNVSAMRSKRPVHTPEVMSFQDVAKLFENMSGVNLLAAQLMYGAGLRISDVASIRLKDGNVFNAKTGNQLKPGRQSSGYLTVSLYDGTAPKHPKSYLVHRLVAGAFLGNSDLQINHIDGDKENNRVSNLEWCSAIHNREHYLSELKE